MEHIATYIVLSGVNCIDEANSSYLLFNSLIIAVGKTRTSMCLQACVG